MVRECFMFKKGKCKFGDKCRYNHVSKSKGPGKQMVTICQRFISKEGCKGGCDQIHAFEEDNELIELCQKGIQILNIRVDEIDKLKQQMAMVLKLEEKDVYELPTPVEDYSWDVTHPAEPPCPPPSAASHNKAPSLTFSSFLGQADNTRYRNESRTAAYPSSHAPRSDGGEYKKYGDDGGEYKRYGDDAGRTGGSRTSSIGRSTGDEYASFGADSWRAGSGRSSRPEARDTGDQYEREVKQLERLYRGRCQVLANQEGTMFQLVMKPTDPDWNLTLLDLNFDVFIPFGYPNAPCSIEFCDEKVSESTNDLINLAIKDEVYAREGTMCLRPMLRWVDRNILEMLQPETQFHTHSSLKVYKKGEIEWSSDSDTADDTAPAPSTSQQHAPEDGTGEFLDKDLGTSVRLMDLNLHASSHGLIPHKLLFLLTCLRCKQESELLVAANARRSVVCTRCSMELACHAYKKLCLPSSGALACAELTGCSVSDVLLGRSQIQSICTECSNSTLVTLSSGSNNTTWCNSCGKKMTISFEGIKTVVITPPLASGKQRKSTKSDKGYVEGQPLPDKGACKHYRKSLRWFRFSCCSRLFPCDRCHDAALPDCALEQAHRMVCGLCAKEQAVNAQCKFCHGDVAGAGRSHHWEGGKGCRNQSKMSKDDPKKFKNSKLKTQSQKDKRVGKNKKKETDQT